MKKILLLLASGLLVGCSPSESAIATAIAQTQEIEILKAAATKLAEIEPTMTDVPNEEIFVEGENIYLDEDGGQINIDNYPFCHPNMECEDLFNEPIASGYMDVIRFESNLDGEVLTATYSLAELPESFTINRDFVDLNFLEYAWTIEIDVDGNRDTGRGNIINGCEYFLDISHAKFEEGEISGPFEEIFDFYLAEIGDDASFIVGKPEISVDYNAKQVTLIMEIPRISESSILFIYTNESGEGTNFGSNDWMDNVMILGEMSRLKY